MSLTESDVHKDVNRAFIDRNSSYIVFTRNEMDDDGAGGKIPAGPTSLNPQRVRVVGQVHPGTLMTDDGRQVQIALSIVGETGLDVLIGDYFIFGNYEYEVVNVQDQPDWRVVVESIRRTGSLAPVGGAFDSAFDLGFE